MIMKAKQEIKTSKSLAKRTNLQKAKVSNKKSENIFVCKQNDKECWHRYSSAMGDCV